ncbi:MAG: S-layer homology domain-containing protein [Oscillospiraceae bacterium]|nr:S-layer homology domain-containing protein [Oscillospiraceae bacterium]
MKTKNKKALSALLGFALVFGLFAFAPFSAGAEGGAGPVAGAGYSYTVAIDGEGSLWAWGINYYGQLGDGTTDNRNAPKKIASGKKFTRVSAGYGHTVAIDSDGGLWAWGWNQYGQLGDGTTDDKKEPTRIAPKVKFAQVAVGGDHAVAIDSEGNLWAWGRNQYGQLGDGTTAHKKEPTKIASKVKFAQVSAGAFHTVAIDSEGSLWAWGDNLYGQLGDGTNTDKKEPAKVASGKKFAQISAGDLHTEAIDSDGGLWAWGNNDYGQLGDGTTTKRKEPAKIASETKFAQVSAGGAHTAAIDSEGSLWAWGRNQYGQFGDGTTTSKKEPARIVSETKFAQVSTGAYHTLAIAGDGSLWAWGWNNYGQIGDGTNTDRKVPVKIINAAVNTPDPKPFPFEDVREGDWYYDDVKTAWQSGLINGKSDKLFAPGDNLTYAEAVKLAACMHQLYTTGTVTLTPGAGGDWHSTYVSYAKANNIIAKDYAWNMPATRAGYMEIFAGALPDDALAAVNTVPDGSIPDVPTSHAQASAIYKLYRAGIVQGVDTVTRECNPDSNIRRSEVAAILTRMMNPGKRVEFALTLHFFVNCQPNLPVM